MKSREPRDGRAANGGVNSREPRDGRAANGGVNSRERRHQGSRRVDSLTARDKIQEQIKHLKKRTKQKRGEGTTLTVWSGLLSRCTQQGETRNTQTRKYFKIIVFNDNIKGRQGKVDTPGITSRNTGNDE